MAFTPYITIYPEGNFDYSWSGDSSIRAMLIFSKHLDYNKSLFRKRVNIHLGDEERIHPHGSIKSIWIKNPVDTSLQQNEVDKINIFLKIIYDSLIKIATIEGWDITSFEKAYQLSLADQGIFISHTPFKANKSRSLKARIKHTLDKGGKVPVVAEFVDAKSNAQFEIPVIDTYLYFIDWERAFEKPVWLDNEKFGFNFLKSQLQIFANTASGQSETVISEKDRSREEIEYQLTRLTYESKSGKNGEVAS